jgi:hypothetical protein
MVDLFTKMLTLFDIQSFDYELFGYPIFWLWSLDIQSFDYGRWISILLTMVVGYPIFWLWSLDIQSFDYGRWISNLLTMVVPYEGYSRNAWCALDLIVTFYYHGMIKLLFVTWWWWLFCTRPNDDMYCYIVLTYWSNSSCVLMSHLK